MDDLRCAPVGFFDSGLGGLSVLKETLKMLPSENYIYIGDSKRAPYGNRTVDDLKAISLEITEKLMDMGCKAVVVACNTATSAAVNYLREKFPQFPIVGAEPALKPAVKENPNGSLLVLATKRTLEEKKFAELLKNVASERNVISLPMVGLVELIESGKKDDERTFEFIKNKLKDIDLKETSAIILGCTHYPFIRHHLIRLAPGVRLYDGSGGIARRLYGILKEKNLLNPGDNKECSGKVEIFNTLSQELIKISENLLYGE